MMIQTPAQAMANRTARIVAENKRPVYTSTTPAQREREHLSAVEVEFDTGGRFWENMRDDEVDAYIDNLPEGTMVSDIDHSAKCWCQ